MGDGIRRNKHNEIGTQIARVSARSNWEKEQVSKFLEQRGASECSKRGRASRSPVLCKRRLGRNLGEMRRSRVTFRLTRGNWRAYASVRTQTQKMSKGLRRREQRRSEYQDAMNHK